MSNDDSSAAQVQEDGAVVIVACMDRRLVEILKLFGDLEMPLEEKQKKLKSLFKNDSDVYKQLSELIGAVAPEKIRIVANAGANVNGVASTLNEIKDQEGISRIIVVTHTDCGGMATIANGLFTKATEENNEIFRHLGGARYQKTYSPQDYRREDIGVKRIRSKVEGINPDIQEEAAGKFCDNVTVVQVEVDELKEVSIGREHWLVKAPYGKGSYPKAFEGTPKWQTYGLVGRRRDLVIDERIADTIGMDVILERRPRRVKG